jgi:hypothetical protein
MVEEALASSQQELVNKQSALPGLLLTMKMKAVFASKHQYLTFQYSSK